MMIVDSFFFDHPEVVGKRLTRDEALGSEWIKDLWHLVDHIVSEDVRVVGAMRWLAEPNASDRLDNR